MKVTQVLCAAGPVDAVTNQALACRALFGAWGWEGEDYSRGDRARACRAAIRAAAARARGRATATCCCCTTRAMLAASSELFELPPAQLADLPQHHAGAVLLGARAGRGRPLRARAAASSPSSAAASGALAGVSEYNAARAARADAAATRRDPGAVRPRAGSAPPAPSRPAGPPTILFVGRLAPAQAPGPRDPRVRAATARAAPDARLVLVGTPLSPDFEAHAARAGRASWRPGAVTLRARDLARAARRRTTAPPHVFLCLSEHEGFCIPLLEAFHFGVPVIARDAGAVGEVVGDAGVLLGPEDDGSSVGRRAAADRRRRRRAARRAASARASAGSTPTTYARTAARLRDGARRAGGGDERARAARARAQPRLGSTARCSSAG